MVSKEILQKLSSYFAGVSEVNTVYLFGSTIKGKERENSDLDLAVLFQPGLDQLSRFDAKLSIMCELEELISIKIDLVDLESADLYFIHQVMLHKLLIFEQDNRRRIAFEVKYRKDFFDRQYFYDIYHEQVRKRLRERL